MHCTLSAKTQDNYLFIYLFDSHGRKMDSQLKTVLDILVNSKVRMLKEPQSPKCRDDDS